MNDPHIWWYVTRTSAILAWTLMTLSVMWGVLLSTRVLRKVDDAGRLQDLHRYLGGLSLLMIGLHMVSLMFDGWLHLTPAQVLVPFESQYRPPAVALGIVAFYLLMAIYGSSLIRDRLPKRFWKGLHYANYAAVLLIAFHGGLAGSDVGAWWYLSLATALISLTAVSVVVRLVLTSRAAHPASAAVAPTPRRATIDATPAPMVAGVDATTMLVVSLTDVAAGVRLIRLMPVGGGEVPPWEPGSHLTLEFPNGETRQYSLCGDPADRMQYEIAVLRDPQSRGASAWLHEGLRVGMTLTVWAPRNHFPLVASTDYLFVAGGIGITPLRAMIDALPARREWRLLYFGRARSTMAFLAELLSRFPDRVYVYARDEHEGRGDVATAVEQLSTAATQVYCCGPEGLIETVRAATPPDRFHTEHFTPVLRLAPAPALALTVEAARSGVEVTVGAGQSVLEALEADGIPVLASCRRGVCGSCELRVLSGTPQHLDSVLDDQEKTELGVMYPCVSRAVGDRLVLDV